MQNCLGKQSAGVPSMCGLVNGLSPKVIYLGVHFYILRFMTDMTDRTLS